jgi:membrane-associated protease RseP (regulator of RpoE activity)
MVATPDWKNDAELAGLKSARTRAGGVGGLSDKRLATLPSVTVAGQTFESVPALFNTVPDDLPVTGANIGIDMLQRFRLAVDFTGDTLYLTPTPAIARPLPKDRIGMRLELAGNALKVVYVSPDGPAAAAGWKQGDTITAIDGMKVSPDFYRSRYASFTRLAAGTRLDLVRGDGTHLPVVLTDFF